MMVIAKMDTGKNMVKKLPKVKDLNVNKRNILIVEVSFSNLLKAEQLLTRKREFTGYHNS
jgi:hypothetical protein